MSQPIPLWENGTVPQPAMAEKNRGARSLAGLNPACVSGAKTHISVVSAMPIAIGVIGPGPDLFSLAVNPKITRANRSVPKNSAQMAVMCDTGFAKYSPNILAVAILSGSPLVMCLDSSKALIWLSKRKKTADAAMNAPSNWATK